ncbi:hypothetical protein E5676_scaffold148G00210 [Cucumis melo var. makuwa]|uniref:Uncharacterized protein n=1 Tax=Cucumis melo var. makuwa TaxID=1194695 RepID=A0A5D3BWR8_CUCMM|nr:hypothetical protein E5676_scaffold148G00210 [Cucumis melo var. makuwa]
MGRVVWWGQRCVTSRQTSPQPEGFGCNLHSKTRWFVGSYNSHQVSHFATFFIDQEPRYPLLRVIVSNATRMLRPLHTEVGVGGRLHFWWSPSVNSFKLHAWDATRAPHTPTGHGACWAQKSYHNLSSIFAMHHRRLCATLSQGLDLYTSTISYTWASKDGFLRLVL